MRRAVIVAVAVVAAAGGVMLSTTGGGGGDGAATANIWVELGAGACARSATPVVHADSASPDARCGTFDAAYDAANAGDTARVKNGSYGAQDITGTKASDVTFIGESQAGVVLTGGTQSGSHFHLQNATINSGSSHGWSVRINASDITWTDVIARGSYIGVERFAGDRWIWDGGSLGVEGDTPGLRCGGSPNFDIEPIQINGGTGHRIANLVVWPQAGADPPCQTDGFHEEDIRVHSSSTTIENVEFKDGTNVNRNAGSGKIFLSGSGVQNLVIRNVIFAPGAPDANNAIDANVTGCTVTITYSTFTTKGTSLAGCTVTNVHNIGPNAPGVSLTTGRLSASATTAIDQAEASCASTLGTAGNVDIDGDLRPAGAACDKGADEYTGGTP